ILDLGFEVVAITSDHSTPAVLGSHSWHPNPFLLYAPQTARTEGKPGFSERRCARGVLGHFNSLDVMPLLLAHARRLKKFGA
ncbi:phosphoglycerate mutase, partial [candidate division WOR-3 bacterium]|nr:phosphoglycerate mutase [candidate division WOR-3 bacterium]